MCGIAGFLTGNVAQPLDRSLLERMTGALRHRGPDEEGHFVQRGVALGVRRLAIVDLQNGQQPIFNEDHSVVAVCNGEIYNHRSLRNLLQSHGHQFRAQVDVEVIVHLYEEFGIDFIEKLEGQFAFAVWDSLKRLLLLGRDQAGIAPLFYTRQGSMFLFASEIKALVESRDVERRVDMTGLDQVLTFPGPVSPRTLFAGVSSLPAGQYLKVTDTSEERRTYWDLEYPRENDIDPAANPDFDDLSLRLQSAVAKRLQADVPVGFYVSGGLDSSLIASLIHSHDTAKSDDRPRHAFSIGFEQSLIDERPYQELIARQLNAHHHSLIFGTRDMELRLRQAVWHAEAPLKESYNTCSLMLSQMVRSQNMKVVLTGEGADELFGGYVGYSLTRPHDEDSEMTLEAQLEREHRIRMWGDADFFYERDYYAFQELKSALYAPRLAACLKTFDCCREPAIDTAKIRGRHPLHQRSYVDWKLRLSDHLLADHGDRVAYANSVEARYPYLDMAVIDWVRSTPPRWLTFGSAAKYPLRRVAGRYVPAQIVNREKFGFVAPSCATLLQSGVDWVEDLLSYERIKHAGYFNPDFIERLKKQYRHPGFEVHTTFDLDVLMIVLTFELLRETFSIGEV